jgi:threonyl-tRNA synthetase
MNQEQLDHLRHSAAHLLAAAVLELWPNAKRTIGPAIDNGFYYDFDFGSVKITEEDLVRLEEKMHALAPTWTHFERKEVSAATAKDFYKDNEYKQELINEFAGEGQTLTMYTSGTYTDLCRGGHSEHPDKELQHFKLLSIAGAYWRGSEQNKMLTRIYGTAWPTHAELEAHLNRLEEAKKRDHRKLGKELGLFVFSDLIGPGMPLYTPRGTAVRSEIIRFSRELNSEIGFEEVHTPNVNKAELFKISGHYDKYKDDMFRVVSHYSDEEFYLKPMNCPQHTQIYASQMRSYKDLPLRFADFANLYRDERPGELSGLTRLRCFSQDDGHCFCREDQIEAEFNAVLQAITKALGVYGLQYQIRLSLRDPETKEKYLGDDATWDKAETTLRRLLEENKIAFTAVEGEAAFYGPKMDIMATDSLGREWQVSTVQLDLNMAVRFGLTYVDSDGTEKNPVMIHRALIGSPERFMGILIEHYAGAFPLWLAPVQLGVVPVSSKHIEAAKACAERFKQAGVRVQTDETDETVGKKVRKAAGEKIPYIVVIGDREAAGEIWTIRVRGQDDQIKMMEEEFKEKMLQEIKERR